jgi:hypothetical protein
MKLNLLWYCPLVVSVFVLLVVPNARSGYYNVVLVFRRLSWGLLFSLSANMLFSSLLCSLFVPLRLLLFMPLFFEPTLSNYRRRYWFSLGLVAVIVIADVVFKVLMWGSFPLLVDKNGYERLRFIPFFPWPDAPKFE